MFYHQMLVDYPTLLHESTPSLLPLAADKSDKGVDDAEVLGILHSLYTMTFTSQGRQSVAFVFSLDDNLKVLLPFIEVTGRVSIKSTYIALLPYIIGHQCTPATL